MIKLEATSRKGSDTMSAYFEKMLHQRLRFQGTYSGCKVFKKKDRKRTIVYYIISFKNLVEVKSKRLFRDHNHIKVSKKIYLRFAPLPINQLDYQFTAEIYRYTQPPKNHNGFYYRTFELGLKEIKKIREVSIESLNLNP